MNKTISWVGDYGTETLIFMDNKVVRTIKPYNKPETITIFEISNGNLEIVADYSLV